MDASKLTDQQLYAIIQNNKLEHSVRAAANTEFNRRSIPPSKVEEIITAHDKAFVPDKPEALKLYWKILLVLLPFFWVIHGLIAGRMLAKGQKRKWNEYWLYLMIGLVLWTIGIIAFAKFSSLK